LLRSAAAAVVDSSSAVADAAAAANVKKNIYIYIIQAIMSDLYKRQTEREAEII